VPAPPLGFGPPPGPQSYDPHGIGAAATRLTGGPRRTGKLALAVLGAVLHGGDTVTMVVQGSVRGHAGVAALLPDKVVLVNERQWKPDVVVLPIDASLAVQGWQDERSAVLTFIVEDRHEVVERILDRGLAIEMAQRIRYQISGPPDPAPATAAAPQPPPPPPPPPPV
jgi:hypothetical protein